MTDDGDGERRIVGYAPGVYDLFHVGHLNLLRRARRSCDVLVAGVVSDEMAMRAKSRRPVVPLDERVEIVRACRYVDDVFVETQPDKLVTWESVCFDVIFKGDDWLGSPLWTRLGAEFAERGVEVVYLPYTEHLSSRTLRPFEGIEEGRPLRVHDV